MISYPTLATSLNGGLTISSYSLEMDDGLGGLFTVLTGYTTSSLATTHLINTGIIQGRTYRTRYRA
jgi:hypothetical protein